MAIFCSVIDPHNGSNCQCKLVDSSDPEPHSLRIVDKNFCSLPLN